VADFREYQSHPMTSRCVCLIIGIHDGAKISSSHGVRDSDSGICNDDGIMSSFGECFFLCRDSSGDRLFSSGLGCGNDGLFQGNHAHRAMGG